MKILVAEDDRVSRKVLHRHLSKWDHEPICAEDGARAWELLRSSDDFHLAILDWNMPGLNGVELCRKIRQTPRLCHLYLILLTGRAEKKDLVDGLAAGADDYIVKPFDPLELSSRLEVGRRIVEQNLLLQEQNKALERYAHDMESLAEQRSRMLIHADRLASLGTLTAGIAHEINNPTTFISGNAQTLERIWPIIETALMTVRADDSVKAKKIDLVLGEYPRMIAGIRNGVSRVTAIVKGLKSFARLDRGAMKRLDINACLEEGMLICGNRMKRLQIIRELAAALPPIDGDPQQLEQVFINLFVNSADALEESGVKNGQLVLHSRHEDGWVVVEVRDNGPGIPSERCDDIWKPFFTTKETGKGTGLGLAISQGIIAEHGGRIGVARGPEGGACFTVHLPVPEGGCP